jgi:stress responsive alpha/beta barrel protein
MFIHMFAFRWKAHATEAQKDRAISQIRDFQGTIPGLIEVWVGRNVSPRGDGYEFGGAMKFVDQAALEAYNDHPAHQELLGWLMPLINPIEVDFPA